MSQRRTFRTRLMTGAVAAPLALALVACGSDDDDNDDDVSAPISSAPATTAAPADPSDAPTSDAPTSAPAAGDDGGLAAAALTALGAVDGSTLFSIDRNNGGWEVSVVSADGTENEVDVDAAGSTITRGPVEDTDDGDDDTTDQAERERLLDAQVDYLAAIEAAQGAVPGGTVTGADLDEDNGTATWEVQLDEDTAQEQTVTVDAASGDVLRTEQDD